MSNTTVSFVESVEDHALTRVPQNERRSGWALVSNTAGIATTLVQLAIAATISAMIGVKWAILAGIIVAIFGAALGWLMGHVAYVSGTSSTVTTRYYGLGRRGSALASLVFAFMILGFLALENALLYYGTLFAFQWQPTVMNAVVIYGVFTIAWIILTTYGMRVVQATSIVLLIAFLVLVVALAAYAVVSSPQSVAAIVNSGGPQPGNGGFWNGFLSVIAILAGSAGALALVDADYARYARTTRDVGILAVGGSLAIDVVVVIIGALIGQASGGKVIEYLNANAGAANALIGSTVAEKVSWMLMNDAGAYFIILFGLAGFILMYVAQVKAQVLNTYSGSLSLTNLSESILGWSPSRVVMVIVGNIIALGMIAADILGLIAAYLAILGTTTTAIAAVVIADFFIVRKGEPARVGEMEPVNWAGCASVVVAVILATVMTDRGITPLGFVVSLVVVLVLYPILRRMLPARRGATPGPAASSGTRE